MTSPSNLFITSPLRLSHALAAVLIAATAACTAGDDSLATDPSTTDDPTEGTTLAPGSTTDEPTTDTPEPGDTDYDEMAACELPVVCEPFTHLFAEGDPYHPEMEPLLPGEECVWTGLRDGTPGRYAYTTNHEFGNGNEDVTYIIHVHADRKVTFAAAFKLNVDEDEEDEAGFRPAKTCTLAEPAFFDDCLQSADPNGDHPDCAWTQKWWVDCVEDGPKCE